MHRRARDCEATMCVRAAASPQMLTRRRHHRSTRGAPFPQSSSEEASSAPRGARASERAIRLHPSFCSQRVVPRRQPLSGPYARGQAPDLWLSRLRLLRIQVTNRWIDLLAHHGQALDPGTSLEPFSASQEGGRGERRPVEGRSSMEGFECGRPVSRVDRLYHSLFVSSRYIS